MERGLSLWYCDGTRIHVHPCLTGTESCWDQVLLCVSLWWSQAWDANTLASIFVLITGTFLFNSATWITCSDISFQPSLPCDLLVKICHGGSGQHPDGEIKCMTNILYIWYTGADKYFQLDLKEKIYKLLGEGLPSRISQWQQQNDFFKLKMGLQRLDPLQSCLGLHGCSKWICQHLFPQVFFPQNLREVLLEQMPSCSGSVSSEAFSDTALMRKAVLQPKPHFKAPLFWIFLLSEFDCVNLTNILRCRWAYVAAK